MTEIRERDASRRRSLQFRDFGPAQKVPSGELSGDLAVMVAAGAGPVGVNRAESLAITVAQRIGADRDKFPCRSEQVGLLSRYRQCALGPRSSTSSG